jgi:hypothetical protein
MIKVLYLFGSSAGPGGRKSQALRREADFEVREPPLPFPAWRPSGMADGLKWIAEAVPSWPAACSMAQAWADEFEPDVIVGSSMGGAVAIGIDSPAGRVLIAPAMELSGFGHTYPNPLSDRRIPARTVILHAEADTLVPFAASLRLLEEAANRADPSAAAEMVVIQEQLREAGYATRHGRLIPIGHDHQCNEPDPNDTGNRDPDPHRAMVRAVRIVAGK